MHFYVNRCPKLQSSPLKLKPKATNQTAVFDVFLARIGMYTQHLVNIFSFDSETPAAEHCIVCLNLDQSLAPMNHISR